MVLLGGLQSAATPQLPPGYLWSFRWTSPDDPHFGGFSGIELSDDGTGITVLSDRGGWTSGQVIRDADGRIAAVEAGPVRPLLATEGAWPSAGLNDSEGLAIAPDGTAYVSFEGDARVQRYPALGGPSERLPEHRYFARFPINGALEALAVDAQGRLYTMPEGGSLASRPIPVLRFDGTEWTHVFSLPRSNGFLPVGADFGPDGRLYILERKFLGMGGFASRVRAVDVAAVDAENRVTPVTVMESPPGLHDNLESIAVWADATGSLRLTMIADDNFLFYQRNEIVEYRLDR